MRWLQSSLLSRPHSKKTSLFASSCTSLRLRFGIRVSSFLPFSLAPPALLAMTSVATLMKKALLALEDGRVFEGTAFGADATHTGEICFNTSMSGYQEVLTDPSYRGQIVTMTYPMIGNYGVNPLDMESDAPHVRGFVIEELCDVPSNWRSTQSLDAFLKQWNIPGIQGVDLSLIHI